jgi:hypothetical protein
MASVYFDVRASIKIRQVVSNCIAGDKQVHINLYSTCTMPYLTDLNVYH